MSINRWLGDGIQFIDSSACQSTANGPDCLTMRVDLLKSVAGDKPNDIAWQSTTWKNVILEVSIERTANILNR